MDEARPETEQVAFELLEDSDDVVRNWNLPYRTGTVSCEETESRTSHRRKSQEDDDWEGRQGKHARVEKGQLASEASRRKSASNSQAKARTHQKSTPLKHRHPPPTAQKFLQVARYQQSPLSILGPNSAPTTSVLPCSLPESLMQQYLHQIPHTLVDMVSRDSSSATYGKSFAMNVMSSITTSPALLNSLIFAQMLYDRVHHGAHSATPIEVDIGATAVEHLNLEISHPGNVVNESSIWAVVCLAYSGREAVLRSGLQYPHQSFLKELQSIHVYCRMEIVLEHVLGLIKMIEVAGGLQNIRTHGMAQMISLAGIIGACRAVQKPIFPFIPHTTTFIQDGELKVSPAEFEAVSSDLGDLGTGFWLVWDVALPSGMHDFFAVIQHACDFTVVVENYVRGRWTPRTSTEIMDQRNYIQHSLMSLPSYRALSADEVYVDEVHYESARLAVIIYSFLVIFPIPPVAGPFETLTRLLRRESEQHILKHARRARLHIQLWILMMGAIASIGLPCRPWFLSELAVYMKMAKIDSWQDLQAILQTFLWHPGTNNVDGLDIWDDVETLD